MAVDSSETKEILNSLCDIDSYGSLLTDFIQDGDVIGIDDYDFNLVESHVKVALAHLEMAYVQMERAIDRKCQPASN